MVPRAFVTEIARGMNPAESTDVYEGTLRATF